MVNVKTSSVVNVSASTTQQHYFMN